jgi:hypothetical protein
MILVNGRFRNVTLVEWSLLRLLRERFRRVVPGEFLWSQISETPSPGGLRVYICRLRRLLRGTPFGIANRHSGYYGLFPVEEVRTLGEKERGTVIRVISLVAVAATLLSDCAGYTSISVTCATQDQSGVGANAAASCAPITITGNTPTATATTTTTATVPVQAPIGPGAGLGLGGQTVPVVPPMTGAIVVPPPTSTMTPSPSRIHTQTPFRNQNQTRKMPVPQVAPSSWLVDYRRLDELFKSRPANPWLASLMQ